MPPYEIPDNIDEAFVQRLVDSKQPETRHYEFKAEIDTKSDKDVRRMLERASAFANTEGGFLVYGIQEFEGRANEIRGIQSDLSDDALKQSIGSLVRRWVDPDLTDEGIEPVTMKDGKRVLVIHVPKSTLSPHMVIHSESNRIYKRNSSGIYPPGLEELRQMFDREEKTQNYMESVIQFHRQRIDYISSGSAHSTASYWLDSGPKLVLHVVPKSAATTRREFDLSLFAKRENQPNDKPVSFNKSGIGTVGFNSFGFQMFINGSFEYACSLVTTEDSKTISATWTETFVEKFGVQRASKWLIAAGVAPPFIIIASLIDMQGVKLGPLITETLSYSGPFVISAPALEDSVVNLPAVELSDLENDVREKLCPIFNAIWRIAGYSCSSKCDLHGIWQLPNPLE